MLLLKTSPWDKWRALICLLIRQFVTININLFCDSSIITNTHIGDMRHRATNFRFSIVSYVNKRYYVFILFYFIFYREILLLCDIKCLLCKLLHPLHHCHHHHLVYIIIVITTKTTVSITRTNNNKQGFSSTWIAEQRY